MTCDIAGHLSPSSSHSSIDMLSSGSPTPKDVAPKAESPPTAQEGVHKPKTRRGQFHSRPAGSKSNAGQPQPAQPAPSNPFAAAALQSRSSSSDLDLSSEDAAASSSQTSPSPPLRSPKSMRTHIQHPLGEADVQWEVANAAAPITPRVRLSMERAHSAGHWTHTRRSFRTIPEDRPVGSSPPKGDVEAVGRPIRKVTSGNNLMLTHCVIPRVVKRETQLNIALVSACVVTH